MRLIHLIGLAIAIKFSAFGAECPASFKLQLFGRCLLVELNKKATWCGAQRTCWTAGGELLNDLDIIRQGGDGLDSISGHLGRKTLRCWLGVSDLVDERNSDTSGWQLSGTADGSLMPSGNEFWRGRGTEPNGGVTENCVSYDQINDRNRLNDATCLRKMGFICQQRPKTEENLIQRKWIRVAMETAVRSGSPQQYCSELTRGCDTLLKCTAFADRQEFPAKAVIFSRSAKLCRVLQFTDSLLSDSDTVGATDWVKMRTAP